MIGQIFTLKQLEALVWVTELGSFRKAAVQLNTTQPNISARIARLESVLGLPLMLRERGRVRLTDKGAEIVEAARIVLRDAEFLVEIAARPDLIEDRLRLGVTELVACTWLHQYLRALKNVYPNVSVELTVDLSASLDQELQGKSLDLTFQNAPFASLATGEIALGEYPYAWVCTPALAFDAGQSYGLEDLLGSGILTHARHTQAFAQLSAYARSKSIPLQRLVPSSSLAACVDMTRDGLGVGLVPEAMVRKEIASGALICLDVAWLPSPLHFAARFQAGKLARFVEHAAQLAQTVASDFQAGDATKE